MSILAEVEDPDVRGVDPAPGRERYWRQRIGGPARWLFVVVDFGVEPAEVITAFGRAEGPPGW